MPLAPLVLPGLEQGPAAPGGGPPHYNDVRDWLQQRRVALLARLQNIGCDNQFRTLWEGWTQVLEENADALNVLDQNRELRRFDVSGLQLQRRVKLDGLRVACDFIGKGTRFGQGLSCIQTIFLGAVDLSESEKTDLPNQPDIDDEPTALGATRVLRVCTFAGATFFEPVRLDGITMRVPCTFTRANFASDLDCQSAKLGRDLMFEGATLAKGLDLSATEIDGDLYMGSAKCLAKFIAVELSVGGRADFAAVFKDCVKATRARFGKNTVLEGARFEGGADFTEATFLGDLEARGLQASKGDVCFKGAQFASDVFMQPSIRGIPSTLGSEENPVNLDFSKVVIGDKGAMDLVGIVVFGDVRFTGSSVKSPTKLQHARIGGTLFFDAVQAGRVIDLEHATLEGVSFRSSVVEQCRFKGCCFGGTDIAASDGKIEFEGVRFGGFVDLTDTHFRRPPSFRGSRFESAVDLDNMRCHRCIPDFRLVRFEVAPSVASLHICTDVNILEPSTSIVLRRILGDKLRALRVMAARDHDDERVNLFRRLELEAVPGDGPGELLEWAYGVLANRGESAWRPLGWLFLVFVIVVGIQLAISETDAAKAVWALKAPTSFECAVLTKPVAGPSANGGAGPLTSAISLSFGNTFLVGILGDSTRSSAEQCLVGDSGQYWQWAVLRLLPVFQVPATFVLLFLAAIGARRRLRIEN